MGYFCYILSPMAGIDRVIIIMARKETIVQITIFLAIFHDNFETYTYNYVPTILSLM